MKTGRQNGDCPQQFRGLSLFCRAVSHPKNRDSHGFLDLLVGDKKYYLGRNQ